MEIARCCCEENNSKRYFDKAQILQRYKLKTKEQSIFKDEAVKDIFTKELEVKQVEFKLGEDCWDMKVLKISKY